MVVPFHSERRRDVRGARQRGGDARRVGDASSLGETCEERREVDVVVNGEDGHHLGRAARSAPLLEDLRATCVANLLRAQRTLSLVPDADARLRRVRIEGRAGRVASSGRKRETRAMRRDRRRGGVQGRRQKDGSRVRRRRRRARAPSRFDGVHHPLRPSYASPGCSSRHGGQCCASCCAGRGRMGPPSHFPLTPPERMWLGDACPCAVQ